MALYSGRLITRIDGPIIWVEGVGGSLKEKKIPNKEIEKDYKLIKLQQPGIHTYFGFGLPSWF